MTDDPIADTAEAISAEGDGVLELCFLTPEDAMNVLLALEAGDRDAITLNWARIMREMFAAIADAPPDSPLRCATCARSLTDICTSADTSFTLVALKAAGPSTKALSFCICTTCANDEAALKVRAHEASRRIWPDLRVLPAMTGQVGHA